MIFRVLCFLLLYLKPTEIIKNAYLNLLILAFSFKKGLIKEVER